MTRLEEKVCALTRAMSTTESYRTYRRLQRRLDQNAEKKAQVDAYRRERFAIHEAEGDILEQMDELSRRYAWLLADEEVRSYLNAENEVCRMIREVCDAVANGIAVDVPEGF